MASKRIININVLPGQPLDGSGKVCIHLFLRDSAGRITEPHVLHPVLGNDGQPINQQLTAKPTRGRLACDPKRGIAPTTRNGITTITPRTDDPRAVTCPRCKASREYQALMAILQPT